ncbi:taurine ABC transporter binding protein [Burkholderia sp. D7]|nr:taurine ABC transporter binding protein [Burkholderia sp. D7]
MPRIRRVIAHFRRHPRRTLAENDHPVREEQRLFHIVCHKQDGEARIQPQLHQLSLHTQPRKRVQLAEGLIEYEQLGIVDKRARQRNTLRHATGQLMRIRRFKVCQADQSQRGVNALFRRTLPCRKRLDRPVPAPRQPPAPSLRLRAKANIGAYRAPRIQGRVLEHHDPAAAWERGDIDATYIWDPVLAKVKKNGKVLITSGEVAKETGKATFDGFAVSRKFAQDNGAFVTGLVKVLAATDAEYRDNKTAWTAGSKEVQDVAQESGATAADVPASLALYAFPTLTEQASPAWLGGGASGAAKSLAATAAFLKTQGTIQNVLPDYSVGVDPRFVQQASR